jgi:hypothetical protein
MEQITSATNDILISIILNNAGYITTGMFADVPLPALMANYECNATCAVRITHHFLNRLLDAGRRGLIGFTSSPAGCMPSPFAAIYGCTKALLTEFAASIAPEVPPRPRRRRRPAPARPPRARRGAGGASRRQSGGCGRGRACAVAACAPASACLRGVGRPAAGPGARSHRAVAAAARPAPFP